jgi:hypothetical protein
MALGLVVHVFAIVLTLLIIAVLTLAWVQVMWPWLRKRYTFANFHRTREAAS